LPGSGAVAPLCLPAPLRLQAPVAHTLGQGLLPAAQALLHRADRDRPIRSLPFALYTPACAWPFCSGSSW
jgi:hypothetical protein